MDEDRDPGSDQRRHWSRIYAGAPAFFGEGPSEFARSALRLFRREGVATVLELGCGQGRDTLFFAANGLAVTALDYSETAVRELAAAAQEKGFRGGVSTLVTTRVQDLKKPLPFPDGHFDACFSHMLLCMELSEAEIAFVLGEVSRVLRPGGVNVYSVRSTFDKHYRAGLPLGEDVYQVDGFVVHFFDEEKVRRLVAGYDLVDIRRMQEGRLPRDLFVVTLRKPGRSRLGSAGALKEVAAMINPTEKFQEFFDATFGARVLENKTKQLVALGAALAAACDA